MGNYVALPLRMGMDVDKLNILIILFHHSYSFIFDKSALRPDIWATNYAWEIMRMQY